MVTSPVLASKPERRQGPSTTCQRGFVPYVARSPASCGDGASPASSVMNDHTATQSRLVVAFQVIEEQPPDPGAAGFPATSLEMSQASGIGVIWLSSFKSSHPVL